MLQAASPSNPVISFQYQEANRLLMFKRILTLVLSAFVALPALAQVTISEEARQRASELVTKMTLEEKIDFIA